MKSLFIILITLALVGIGSSSSFTHSINGPKLESKTTGIMEEVDNSKLVQIIGTIRFLICYWPKVKSRLNGFRNQILEVADALQIVLECFVECVDIVNSDSEERALSDSFISKTGYVKNTISV